METKQITDAQICAEFETSNLAIFRDVLKAVTVVNEEAEITIDPQGLKIIQMGPDHVCMVDLNLSRGFFDHYEVKDDRRFALNLKEVIKLLFNRKTGKLKDSNLEISIDTDRIKFKGSGQLRGVKTYNLLDPLEEEVPPPKVIFRAKTRILANSFKKIIDDCTVNSNISITADPDLLVFKCENDDYLEEHKIDRYADDMLDLWSDGTQKAIYELEYLGNFARALKKISDVVTLEFTTDLPMKISADLPYESHLIYWTAPKILTGEESEEPEAADPDQIDDIPCGIPLEEPEAEEIPEITARAETSAPYVCEVCSAEIPEEKEIRLEDDTILCYKHAPDDLLSQYWRYRKYLAIIEERDQIEAAPTISGGDQ